MLECAIMWMRLGECMFRHGDISEILGVVDVAATFQL